jgi:hypothetical protein
VGEKMKKLKNMMLDGLYSTLYEKLEEMNFHYDLEEYTKCFKGINSEKKYAYLTYVMARCETPDLHLLICDFLSFTDTFFFDRYTVQKWHLKRALEISPNNVKVLQWITCTFNDHPDPPFSEEELSEYNNLLKSL